MKKMGDYIDCKEMARILGYADPVVAARACRDGKIKNAFKMGNAWVADMKDVLQWKISAEEYIKNRRAEMSRRGRSHCLGRKPRKKKDDDQRTE